MAKTLVDRSALAHKRLIRLRADHQWLLAQRNAVEEKLAAKDRKKLDRLAASYNRRLEENAFLACDKQAYAAHRTEQKMRAFDLRRRMKYRAENHGCVKQIFKALHGGEDWSPILQKHEEAIRKLDDQRAAYLQTQRAREEAFVAAHPQVDPAPYEAQMAQLTQAYQRKEQQLALATAQKTAARQAKLDAKLEKCNGKMEKLRAAADSGLKLPENVLLHVEGLKMYFGGLKAVDDLSFDVKKGEIFGLIGPNGAGKTTVFNCITRFYDATAGNMYFENNQGEVVDLRRFKVHDVIIQGITRTFQNVELVREISVMDNLLTACTREYRSNLAVQILGLPMLRAEEKRLKEKALRVLKFMGLESYAGWYAMGLPYGVLKKVEIARALMADAKLIIMDEPAAGLNDTETAELARLIRRIRDEFGVTILLVEHDMSLVMNICDTVCAISFGQMLAIGTCEEIKANKAVQEAYLGVEEDA